MAKCNAKNTRSRKMKRNQDNGVTEGNSRYARKRQLQAKGVFSQNSPFKEDS